MTSTGVTQLVAIIVGLGVISAGVWRIASAVLKLTSKVELLAYRIGQLEQKQAAPSRRVYRRPDVK